ncbi:MAG TPA: RDD family protein [Anaerolineales bacterium]|nr:RDD family protein [Anaerolineales bacterium]
MYAGLQVRIQAFALDYLFIAGYLALLIGLGLIFNFLFPDSSRIVFSNPVLGQFTGFVLITLPVTLYFSLFESSAWQATPGKRLRNLKVMDRRNARLSRLRALSRTLLKFVPWELAHTCIWQMSTSSREPSLPVIAGLVLVWILVGVILASIQTSPKHQAIYDYLAGSYVVTRQKS